MCPLCQPGIALPTRSSVSYSRSSPALLPQFRGTVTAMLNRKRSKQEAAGGDALVRRTATSVREPFGQVLCRFRLAAGLSQEGLADRAGLSAHGISDLERGARTRPYAGTLQRLAEALEL